MTAEKIRSESSSALPARALDRAARCLSSWGVFAAIASCAFLHVTIRDSVQVLAVLFYATPPRLLLLAFLFIAVAAARLRRWKIMGSSLIALCVLLVPGVTSTSAEFDDGGEGRSIALLNAGGGDAGVERVVAHIVEGALAIAILVEAGKLSYRDVALAHGYESVRLAGGIVVLTRGDVVLEGEERVEGYARGHSIRVSGLDVLIIDVVANPFRSRHRAVDAISRWSLAHDPDLILGDFNTPLAAHAFDRLKERYVAGSEAETGRESWPLPFPVLDLDHVFGRSDRARFAAYSIDRNDVSDHCTIRVRVDFP